ncbi:uncharacterized protein LOC131683863 [Topomyia yanbarensis]|uniref:uncharacterized protein LOC131683863 n=1 Tax=Topomyia yanbarensis TaxID=2498891 RepID=UPI00273C1C4D|nr:uncharacterized protein LOC131683863 [Topomyia yanbarensis]
MNDEIVEPATRAVLTLAATLLLQQTNETEDLHEILQRTSNSLVDGGCDVSWDRTGGESSYKAARPAPAKFAIYQDDEKEGSRPRFRTPARPPMQAHAGSPVADRSHKILRYTGSSPQPDEVRRRRPLAALYEAKPGKYRSFLTVDAGPAEGYDDTTISFRNVQSSTMNRPMSFEEGISQGADGSIDQIESSYRLVRPSMPIRRRGQPDTPDMNRSYFAPAPTSVLETPLSTRGRTRTPLGIRRKQHLKKILNNQPSTKFAIYQDDGEEESFRIARPSRPPVFDDNTARLNLDQSYVPSHFAKSSYVTPPIPSARTAQGGSTGQGDKSFRLARPARPLRRRGQPDTPDVDRSYFEPIRTSVPGTPRSALGRIATPLAIPRKQHPKKRMSVEQRIADDQQRVKFTIYQDNEEDSSFRIARPARPLVCDENAVNLDRSFVPAHFAQDSYVTPKKAPISSRTPVRATPTHASRFRAPLATIREDEHSGRSILDQSASIDESFRLARPSVPVRRRGQPDTPDVDRSYFSPATTSLPGTPKTARGRTRTPLGVRRKQHLRKILDDEQRIMSNQPNAQFVIYQDRDPDESFQIARPSKPLVFDENRIASNLDRSFVPTHFAKDSYVTPTKQISPKHRSHVPLQTIREDSRSFAPPTHSTPTVSPIRTPAVENIEAVPFPDATLLSFAPSPDGITHRSTRSNPQIVIDSPYVHDPSFQGLRSSTMYRSRLQPLRFPVHRRQEPVADPRYLSVRNESRIHDGIVHDPSLLESVDDSLLNQSLMPSFQGLNEWSRSEAESGFASGPSEVEEEEAVGHDVSFFGVPASTMDQSRINRSVMPAYRERQERSSLEHESGFISDRSRMETFEDIEAELPPPDLDATVFSIPDASTDNDETVSELLDRIAREVREMRGDRIGILRRDSDDYDFSTGEMQPLRQKHL